MKKYIIMMILIISSIISASAKSKPKAECRMINDSTYIFYNVKEVCVNWGDSVVAVFYIQRPDGTYEHDVFYDYGKIICNYRTTIIVEKHSIAFYDEKYKK